MNKLVGKICAISTCFCIAFTCCAGADTGYLNDGYITYDCLLDDCKNDSAVFVVLNKGCDWTDESFWLSQNSGDVIYYSKVKCDENGALKADFVLPKSGVYEVYASGEPAYHDRIKYVNKTQNDVLLSKLGTLLQEDGDSSKITALIKDVANRYDFAIFSDIFNAADFKTAADVLKKSLKMPLECYETGKNLEKALLMSALYSGGIASIAEYTDALHFDDTLCKYYHEENGKVIADMLNKTPRKSLNEFDEDVRNAVIVSAVNGADGTSEIINILSDFRSAFGLNTVENKLAEYVAKRNNYTTIDDIILHIGTYKPTENNKTNGPSGGGGGGSFSNSHNASSLNDITYDVPENRRETYKVFNDMDSVSWAEEAITSLYKAGMINGKGDGRFCPNDNITREEFVKILINVFKLSTDGGELPFTDVDKDSWYYSYIKCAYASGIVNGISENLFGTGDYITREDLSVMVYNALNVCDYKLAELNDIAEFTDAVEISDYAADAVFAMQRAGVINGYNGAFAPKAFATRAEAVKIIYSIYVSVINAG